MILMTKQTQKAEGNAPIKIHQKKYFSIFFLFGEHLFGIFLNKIFAFRLPSMHSGWCHQLLRLARSDESSEWDFRLVEMAGWVFFSWNVKKKKKQNTFSLACAKKQTNNISVSSVGRNFRRHRHFFSLSLFTSFQRCRNTFDILLLFSCCLKSNDSWCFLAQTHVWRVFFVLDFITPFVFCCFRLR